MVEKSWVLTGKRDGDGWRVRRRRRIAGQATSVEADWAWALSREERRGDVAGFYHTHPGKDTAPSERDIRTMRAWVSALGKPLLCLIAAGRQVSGYLFEDDESSGHAVLVKKIGQEEFQTRDNSSAD